MVNEKNVKEMQTPAETNAVKTLLLQREKFETKDGREMWGYALQGKVNGRDTKVDFVAYDQGGYEVLDMVFDIKPTAQLTMHEETMTDSETGELRKYTIYEVSNVDADGDELTCRVKPARDSDKSILAYMIKKLNRQLAVEKKVKEEKK